MRGVGARRYCAVEGSHELIIHFLSGSGTHDSVVPVPSKSKSAGSSTGPGKRVGRSRVDQEWTSEGEAVKDTPPPL